MRIRSGHEAAWKGMGFLIKTMGLEYHVAPPAESQLRQKRALGLCPIADVPLRIALIVPPNQLLTILA